MQISVHTARGKNLSTGIRFKQVILKGFLRLDLQPVQQIFPTLITDKTIHQPSKDIIRNSKLCVHNGCVCTITVYTRAGVREKYYVARTARLYL